MGLGNFFKKLFGGGPSTGSGQARDYQRRPGAGEYRKPGGGPVPPPQAPRSTPAYVNPNTNKPISDREVHARLKHPYRRWRRSKFPLEGHIHETGSTHWFSPDRTTQPPRLQALGLPVLTAPVELATLTGQELKRVYDCAYGDTWDTREGHYVYRLVPKKRGGWRLIEAPKPRLKAVQKRIKELIVDKLPVSEHAHGFRRKRDMLSNASPHVGKACVICADIQDFFPSIGFNRVAGLLRSHGYGRMVAAALAMLMTNKVWAYGKIRIGDQLVKSAEARKRAPDVFKYKGAFRRTPQGAPTSPGLANAICWRMDKRLAGLAKKFNATYTRYADDLTFSGGVELAGRAGAFLRYVERIVKTEGFKLNEDKTRIMRQPGRQKVTGVVVNQKPNFCRADYDTLKAILHNCVKKGPASQNREKHPHFQAHLAGRVEHVRHLNPARGEKLKALLAQIRW